jgi:hypothetical protein
MVLSGIFVLASLGAAKAQNVATVSVNVSSLGKVIPTAFDGFSIEVDDSANKYLGVASSPNLVFYQLLQNLGKATIRIGGSSEDYSCWNPSQAPQPAGCTFTITQDGLNGFMKASANTGWGPHPRCESDAEFWHLGFAVWSCGSQRCQRIPRE